VKLTAVVHTNDTDDIDIRHWTNYRLIDNTSRDIKHRQCSTSI